MSIEATGDSNDPFDIETWLKGKEAGDLQRHLEARIMNFLFNNDPESIPFQQMVAQLAWIGATSEAKPLLEREIASLTISAECDLMQCRFLKSVGKVSRKFGHFVANHKAEIIIGVALCATAIGLAYVTGYALSASVGGIVVAGVGSLFSQDKKQNPNPPVPSPQTCSKTELAALQSHSLPNLELPSTLDEFLVTSHGIWAGGQFYSNNELLQHSLLAEDLVFSPNLHEKSLQLTYGQLLQRGDEEELRRQLLPLFTRSSPSEQFPIKSLFSNILDAIEQDRLDPELLDFNSPLVPEPAQSKYFETHGIKHPHCVIGGINGINTSFNEASSHALYLGNLAGNRNISWVHNRSHSVPIDLIEVFAANYLGYSPNTSQLLLQQWAEFDMQNKDRPHAKFLQFCHSQGAIHVRNALKDAPEEIRNRIIVVAIAPGAVVPRSLCYESFNYASTKDIVPLGELVFVSAIDSNECGISKAVERVLEHRKELVFLDPHPNATGTDHDFQSPTYGPKIRQHVEDHIKQNGEYK